MQFNYGQNFYSSPTELNRITPSPSLAPNHTKIFTFIQQPKIYHGYMNGYRQSVVRIALQANTFEAQQIKCLNTALDQYFEFYKGQFSKIETAMDLVVALGESIVVLQKAAGFPIFEPLEIAHVSEQTQQYNLWIPILNADCFAAAMKLMLLFMTHHLNMSSFTYHPSFANDIQELIRRMQSFAPKGVNSLRLLEAAYQRHIPWTLVSQTIYQYGYGHYSRWFDSTFTDQTSHLSAAIAKDKHRTSSLLKKAGLPVPQQHIVRDESDAILLAQNMGYPVAIKPSRLDNGKGVTASIMSDEQLRTAYKKASQFSETVLLEKHIPGKDYRLIVLNGKLIWAIERIPAGVTGDGKHSIKELIEQTNQARALVKGEHALMQIKMTQETNEVLKCQGYQIHDVPVPDKFVALSSIANISTGGVPSPVFDQVHPDNKRLAETVANLMRLDIAGIDFIIPDIQKSYLTSTSAIIEVNAQPQLGMITAAHVYAEILETLIPQQGRIPIIVICNHASNDALIQKLCIELSHQYKTVGVAKNKTAFINGAQVNQVASLFQAGEVLLFNPQLDALIYCINHLEDIELQGLPFDYYDCLYFLSAPASCDEFNKDMTFDLINTLFKTCRGDFHISEFGKIYLDGLNIKY